VTTVSLKMPERLERRLARLAESRGASRSDVIRDAVERLLDETADNPGSCLALASDLIGCVDGSADLSHNKKLLEGFGK
jgi:Arc/MetJ-type ribon-helix-helix transcriptional regulator